MLLTSDYCLCTAEGKGCGKFTPQPINTKHNNKYSSARHSAVHWDSGWPHLQAVFKALLRRWPPRLPQPINRGRTPSSDDQHCTYLPICLKLCSLAPSLVDEQQDWRDPAVILFGCLIGPLQRCFASEITGLSYNESFFPRKTLRSRV